MLESALGDLDALTSEETERHFTLLTSPWFLGDIQNIFQKPTLQGSCSENHSYSEYNCDLLVTCQQGYKEKYCKWPMSKVPPLLQHVCYDQFKSCYDLILSQLWILYFPTDDDILETKYKMLEKWRMNFPSQIHITGMTFSQKVLLGKLSLTFSFS